MKNQMKTIVLFIINIFILIGSYKLSFYLSLYFSMYKGYEGLITPWLFNLVSIKLFVVVLFLLLCAVKFEHIIMTVGVLIANGIAYLYLLYSGISTGDYYMHLLVAAIDIVLVNLAGLIFNQLTYDEKEHPINKAKDEYEQVQVQLMEMNSKIAEKKTVIKDLESKLEVKAIELKEASLREKEIDATLRAKENQGITLPIKIDFDIEDLKKCFNQYGQVAQREEVVINEKLMEDSKVAENELLHKEKELLERAKVVNSKEKIIEQTIQNLEQISKTIKERMTLLEDKEVYIKKQLKLVEEREDHFSSIVQNQIYETIFNAPDLTKDEVKLKDSTKEIIIDRNDLSEIRKLIEKAAEENGQTA